MIKKLLLVPGLIFALLLSVMILPPRLAAGRTNDLVNLIGSQVLLFFFCLSCWLLNIYILRSFRAANLVKFVFSILGCILLALVFYYGLHTFFGDFPSDPGSDHSKYVGLTRMIYRGLLIGTVFYPTAYFIDGQRRLNNYQIKLEQRKQQDLLVELNQLRQQLNPKFLINALDVLQSKTNEPWVKDYTGQLAEVYRYFLIHHMEVDLIGVKEELAFIDSYIFMLKHRFPGGIEVDQRLNPDAATGFLPTFSIQLLVENAVKHNVVATDHPLLISIYEEEGHIVVSNTKRKRFSGGSNGIGLRNLQERYRLLSDKTILIEENQYLFMVRLPLFENGGQ
jgi:sensor histidine kinase YesM